MAVRFGMDYVVEQRRDRRRPLTRVMWRAVACMLAAAAVGACGPSGAATRPNVPSSPSPSVNASPPASPTPIVASPAASAVPAPLPASIAVTFTGVPSGTYPVHIHSICNGSQAFHIVVVQSLAAAGGSGTIQVPSGYFGRGLCVIVYTSPAATRVLATRPI